MALPTSAYSYAYSYMALLNERGLLDMLSDAQIRAISDRIYDGFYGGGRNAGKSFAAEIAADLTKKNALLRKLKEDDNPTEAEYAVWYKARSVVNGDRDAITEYYEDRQRPQIRTDVDGRRIITELDRAKGLKVPKGWLRAIDGDYWIEPVAKTEPKEVELPQWPPPRALDL